MMQTRRTRALAAALLVAAAPLYAGAQATTPTAAQVAARQRMDSIAQSFEKTEVMIPMRDGVKLHTAIYAPKVRTGPLPIIFVRTPYGIAARAAGHRLARTPSSRQEGYIFVFQDIRGRFTSEGQFVMLRARRATSEGPEGDRREHRRVRHDRLAGEERARTTTAASACSACRTRAGSP